jgi:hypothetical protein
VLWSEPREAGKPRVADFDGQLARVNKAKAPDSRLASRHESHPGPEPDGGSLMPTIIMQARFGETGYAVGRLVLQRARALGISRSALVRRLGYRDVNGGHRALLQLLMTGSVPPFIASRLADALEIEPDLLDEVLVATARQQQDEVRAQILHRERAYRDRFRPHLRSETERQVPSPIFVAALYATARLRIVPTPDQTWRATPDDRNELLKQSIRDHFRAVRGWVPAFGRIIGYTAVVLAGYRSDFGCKYDVEGNPVGPIRQVERLGEAVLLSTVIRD